jgi:hypothetical protein
MIGNPKAQFQGRREPVCTIGTLGMISPLPLRSNQLLDG